MNLSPEVEAYLAKAHHALEVAEKLQLGKDFSDAAGKAYYAMFYAAQALLKAHGIEVVKHSAVASMLGHHFAKTGLLDPKFQPQVSPNVPECTACQRGCRLWPL